MPFKVIEGTSDANLEELLNQWAATLSPAASIEQVSSMASERRSGEARLVVTVFYTTGGVYNQ